jgi:uridine kinase
LCFLGDCTPGKEGPLSEELNPDPKRSESLPPDPLSGEDDSPAEIRFRGATLEVPRGISVAELLARNPQPDIDDIFAAVINNRVVSLGSPIVRSGTVEPITYRCRHGARIYRRHLITMLYEVFYSNYPGAKIRVGQAISEGYYFEVDGVKVNGQFLETLRSSIKALAQEKRPFVFRRVPVEEARRLFVQEGTEFKRQVLDFWPSAYVGIMSCGMFVDFALGPIAPHTGYFDRFDLLAVGGDFVLQFPDPGHDVVTRNDGAQPKLYATLKESRQWGQSLGVSHVGHLNSRCIDASIREIIQVAEGLHEKKISDIADQVARRSRRLVLIAGPSSAGKTTFTKRLSIQLRVVGLRPVSISLDNYYVDRELTPKDEKGEYDFEALEAIDIPLFNEHLRRILEGERLLTPRYDFSTGKRVVEEKWTPAFLEDRDVLIIEGIHGLNDDLTPAVSANSKYKIYINALNPLAIDEHNRVHTSDARLIRRIVRDRHYRGYSAAQTISTWDSVRRGERIHIFPFQESADEIFDSSLIYEFSVLKIFAERYLLEVPRAHPSFAEAYRLRKFLSMFIAILPGDVPQTSLLREFIGGSSFSY